MPSVNRVFTNYKLYKLQTRYFSQCFELIQFAHIFTRYADTLLQVSDTRTLNKPVTMVSVTGRLAVQFPTGISRYIVSGREQASNCSSLVNSTWLMKIKHRGRRPRIVVGRCE